MAIDVVISGGQTGVDRAALDAARKLGIPHRGWCPRGRRAEDGRIGGEYQLQETTAADYTLRTEWNVRDSDATLVLNQGKLEGGTAVTVDYTRRYRRPCLVIDLDQPDNTTIVKHWLTTHDVRRLNVAGPRESKRPGIYRAARDYLLTLLADD